MGVGFRPSQTPNMSSQKLSWTTRSGPEGTAAFNAEVFEDSDGIATATGGVGVPLVVDCVGGPAFGALPDALRPGGTLVSYGFLGGSDLAFAALPFYRKGIGVRFIQVFQMTGLPLRGAAQQTEAVASAKALIASGVASGHIRPTIGAHFSLDDVIAAHRLMETSRYRGEDRRRCLPRLKIDLRRAGRKRLFLGSQTVEGNLRWIRPPPRSCLSATKRSPI